jgi:hypothetical protein
LAATLRAGTAFNVRFWTDGFVAALERFFFDMFILQAIRFGVQGSMFAIPEPIRFTFGA